MVDFSNDIHVVSYKADTLHSETDPPFDVRAVYAEHGGALFAYALNALGDRAEAEDCVQETFLRAWHSRERYRSSRGSMRTWLFSIMRNLVIDSLRSRSRRPAPSDPNHMDPSNEPVTDDPPLADRLTLYESLGMMTSEHREVIVAVQLNGMSYKQLSEQTGIPVATLRTRMYYGLKAMRTVLGDKTHDE